MSILNQSWNREALRRDLRKPEPTIRKNPKRKLWKNRESDDRSIDEDRNFFRLSGENGSEFKRESLEREAEKATVEADGDAFWWATWTFWPVYCEGQTVWTFQRTWRGSATAGLLDLAACTSRRPRALCRRRFSKAICCSRVAFEVLPGFRLLLIISGRKKGIITRIFA